MRTIKLNRREAILLRDNLVTNQGGYDYTDLCRLDFLAKKLIALQGDYAPKMSEIKREERQTQRKLVKGELPQLEADKVFLGLRLDIEELNEAAETINVEFKVEDGDYEVIREKVMSVTSWQGNDDIRPTIIGMIEAISNAELEASDGESVPEVKKLRRV